MTYLGPFSVLGVDFYRFNPFNSKQQLQGAGKRSSFDVHSSWVLLDWHKFKAKRYPLESNKSGISEDFR